MDYSQLSPNQLVDLLADKMQRNAVITALVGDLTATELRKVKVSPEAKHSLMASNTQTARCAGGASN